MKNLYLIILLFVLNICHVSAQNFLNGSFENTTSVGCDYNNSNSSFNSKMSNVYAFGSAQEVDIKRFDCFITDIPDGDIALGLSPNDAIAIELSTPLVTGTAYSLTFVAYGNPINSNLNDLLIGLSTTSNSQGSALDTVNVVFDAWTNFTIDFIAPIDGNYITITGTGQAGWTDVDMFSLSSPSLSVNELPNNPIKIYSSPAFDYIRVIGISNESSYKIYNILGNTISSGIISNEAKIDISNFKSGLYILRFENGSTSKFIKR